MWLETATVGAAACATMSAVMPEHTAISGGAYDASSGRVASGAAVPAPVFDQVPAVTAPLDPGFRPFYLALRAHRQAVAGSGSTLTLALERSSGAVSRFSMPVFAD